MVTAVEKRMAHNVLSLMSKAIAKAMETIDAHEGKRTYMKHELKLEEALEEPGHKKARKYVHTATYWAKKKKFKVAVKTNLMCPKCETRKPFISVRKVMSPKFHCCKCQHNWNQKVK